MDRNYALSRARAQATVLASVLAIGCLFLAGTAATPTYASPSPSTDAAKLKVLRVGVQNGRLDLLADITKRADEDRVRVDFIANGKRSTFTAPVEDGRIRSKRRLPASQRRMSTGIMEIHYGGNDRVRPTEVRLRAANGKARLQREFLSLHNGVITARGSLADRAHGLVRLVLSYERPNGTVGEWQGRATVRDDGSWRLEENLPSEARAGGHLSIQFTGYLPSRVRGEQIAKELLDGQSFQSGEPISQKPASARAPDASVSVPAAPHAPAPVQITAWRAPGSAPLSDAEAASRVRSAPEKRSANATANSYKPSATELQTYLTGERNKNGKLPAETNPLYAKVTGGFTGTTDEIIQWAAHKWGIPEDLVRAQAVTESYWNQAAMGDQKTVADPLAYPSFSRIAGTSDVKQSLGLMQIKWNHPDANTNGIGTEPLRWKSTAFNVDYTLATIRWYFDGQCSWCTAGYSAGQQWEALAAWYAPYPWKNAGQLEYIAKVKYHLANRTWEGF